MTFPTHFLLSYGGTLMGGREIWSNNIRFWDPTLAGASAPMIDEESALDHAEGNLRTLVAAPGSGFPDSTTISWIKFNQIGPDGRYASESESNTKWLDGADTIRGVAGSNPHPSSVALAITFTTDRQRGRASKGRIYQPAPFLALDTSSLTAGMLGATQATQIANNYKAFLQGLGNWPGLDLTGFVPSVVSGIGEGTAAVITGVKVGRVLDVQRRRRNALPEEYVSVAL